MKTYITLKVGYTAGVYGCSNEYFNTIIINGDEITNIAHYGMYGSDDRINKALEAKGFTGKYIPNDFGKMTKKDIWKGFVSEYTAIEDINNMEVSHD